MSSKSRKHSSAPSRKGQSKALKPDQIDSPDPEMDEHGFVDDLVIVPKERSKWFFILMIALLIFLLIIFIVPAALMSVSGGGVEKSREDYLTYTLPVGGEMVTEMMAQDVFLKRRESIDKVLELDPFLLLPMGIFLGRSSRLEEDVHARLVFLDRLAEVSGIYVSEEDLSAHLRGAVVPKFRSDQEYKSYFMQQRSRVSSMDFEEEYRRMIRVRRFVTMVGDIPQLPDPAWIETTWSEEHIEDRFEFVSLAASSFEEAVRAEGVGDEALDTWYQELEDFAKEAYRTDERRVVSFADVVDVAAFDATALLSKYPTPADTDAEAQALEYYNSVFFDRFIYDPSEEQAGPDAPEDPDAPEFPSVKEYRDFEEVKAIALLEAPIYFALDAWSVDLQDRMLLGEEVDFALEAAALGIAVSTTGELTDAELRALEMRGGDTVADLVRGTSEGNVGNSPLVTETSFGLFHVDQVIPSEIPELAAVRDQVFEEWVIAQAQVRSVETLEAIRSSMEILVPEEGDEAEADPRDSEGEGAAQRYQAESAAFRAACEAAGLTVQVREWIDRRGSISDDPGATEPAHIYLRSNAAANGAQVGEVTAAALNNTRTEAYLVRKDGQREVPLERMGPRDYETYRRRSETAAGSEIRNGLTFEFLQNTYGLTVFDPRTDEERALDEERANRNRAKSGS